MITAVPECGSNKSCMTSKTRIENVIGYFDCTTVSNCFLHEIIQYLPIVKLYMVSECPVWFPLDHRSFDPREQHWSGRELACSEQRGFVPHWHLSPKDSWPGCGPYRAPLSVVEIYFHWAGTDADSIISTLIVGSQLSVGDKEI